MLRLQALLVIGLAAILGLSGCASAGVATSHPPVEATTGTELDMDGLDVSAVPEGPTVGELITVADFQDVLGTDDLTLSAAT
jgi:hypothetical protein